MYNLIRAFVLKAVINTNLFFGNKKTIFLLIWATELPSNIITMKNGGKNSERDEKERMQELVCVWVSDILTNHHLYQLTLCSHSHFL